MILFQFVLIKYILSYSGFHYDNKRLKNNQISDDHNIEIGFQ